MKYLPGYNHYNFDLQETADELRKSTTKAENKMWYDLFKKASYRVYRQRPIGSCIVDFYIPHCKLVVEIDGDYHMTEEQKQKDKLRDEALISLGYHVIRFSNEQVMKDLIYVKNSLYAEMKMISLEAILKK